MANAQDLKSDFVANGQAAAAKLVKNYTARTDKVARASSDDAQARYETAMRDPATLKRRQSKLKKVNEADLNAAMAAKGSSNFSTGIGAAGDKWANNVQPYLDEQDRIVKTLKPAGMDVQANVMNRVAPLAVGLHQKKITQG